MAAEVDGGGAGPLGVLEGERRIERGQLGDAQGVGEVLLGLAGEPDDDVGRDGHARDGVARLGDEVEVAARAIGALHEAKDPVRS